MTLVTIAGPHRHHICRMSLNTQLFHHFRAKMQFYHSARAPCPSAAGKLWDTTQDTKIHQQMNRKYTEETIKYRPPKRSPKGNTNSHKSQKVRLRRPLKNKDEKHIKKSAIFGTLWPGSSGLKPRRELYFHIFSMSPKSHQKGS